MEFYGINRSQNSLRFLALQRLAVIDAKKPRGDVEKMQAALVRRAGDKSPLAGQELEVLLAMADGINSFEGQSVSEQTSTTLIGLFSHYLLNSLNLSIAKQPLILRISQCPWNETARRLTSALLKLDAPNPVFEAFLSKALDLWTNRSQLDDDGFLQWAYAFHGFFQGFGDTDAVRNNTANLVFERVLPLFVHSDFQVELHNRLSAAEQTLDGSPSRQLGQMKLNGNAAPAKAPLNVQDLSLPKEVLYRAVDQPVWYPGPAQFDLAFSRLSAQYAKSVGCSDEELAKLAQLSAAKLKQIDSASQFRQSTTPHLIPITYATMYSHFDVLYEAVKHDAISKDDAFALAVHCLTADQYGNKSDQVLAVARVAAECTRDSSSIRSQLLPLLPGFFGALDAQTAYRAGKILAGGLENASESTKVNVLYTLVNELTADECAIRTASSGSEMDFLNFVASDLSALVAFVNTYDDIQICCLAVSILAQKFGTVNLGLDVQILETWALLASKLSEDDFERILDQILRAERAAWKQNSKRLVRAVEEARVTIGKGLERGSLLHRIFLKHILDQVILQGEMRHVNSDPDSRKSAQRSARDLVAPLASALPGLKEKPADFGGDWSLTAKFRDVWFNLAVLGLRADDPNLSAQELRCLKVIARSTPPLVSEASANHVESDLELNPVLRRDVPSSVYKQQRDWLARIAPLKPTYGSVKTMFLVASCLLENLRAQAGVIAQIPRYFEDPDFRAGNGFGSMRAIGVFCVEQFIRQVNDRLLPLDTVAVQLKKLLVLCCHRLDTVRRVALELSNFMIKEIPASLCHRTSMFALLDLLSLMKISCVDAEEDEYEPRTKFEASKSGVVIELSDMYDSREQAMRELLGYARKWFGSIMPKMESDAKSLLAAYLDDPETAGSDDYDNNTGGARHTALGRSFALEIATAANGDFIAQYLTQFHTLHDVSYDELLHRYDELIAGGKPTIQEIRSIYGLSLRFFDSDKTYQQLTLAKRSVQLAFLAFTGASMSSGTIYWNHILHKSPHLRLAILEEVSLQFARTVHERRGLFSRHLDGTEPMFSQMEYAPSEKRVIDREIMLLNRQFAPHVRLLEYLRSHMRASVDGNGPGLELFADLLKVALLGVTRFASMHTIARSARLEILTMGFELLPVLRRTGHHRSREFERDVILAGLSWYKHEVPQWPFGGNLVDQRLVVRLLNGLLHHLNSLPRATASGRLFYQLTAQEQSRLLVWLDPLGEAKQDTKAVVFNKSNMNEAWSIDPALAVSLVNWSCDKSAHSELVSLIAQNPLPVIKCPSALQYFLQAAGKTHYKHVILYWAQVSPIESINLLSSKHANDSYLLQYTLRSLETHPITKCFFYVPQIVQQLRHDTGGYVEEYILQAAKFSQKFAHQIIWNILANSYLDDEGTKPDPMKPTLDKVLAKIKEEFTPEERRYYELEFGFFNEVTDISGKLKPYIKKSKVEKKAKIDEEIAKIKVPPEAYLPSHPDGVVVDIDRESGRPLQSHAKAPFLANFKIRTEHVDIGEDLQETETKSVERWQGAIFKVGDDCRQDLLALQIISVFRSIFNESGIDLFVFPNKVTPTAPGCGVIDVLPNSISRDMLGREAVNGLHEWFISKFGGEDSLHYQRARNNFVKSMAAYSVISYLLQFKDRHNGNIMYDGDGHIIHIDFGFCFEIVPGGVRFEAAPFKLTKEMIAVMGGSQTAQPFKWFEELCVKAYLASRVYAEDICRMVAPMLESSLPCFKGDTLGKLRSRFVLQKSDREAAQYMRSLIQKSYNSNYTKGYDEFQRLTNGIPY